MGHLWLGFEGYRAADVLADRRATGGWGQGKARTVSRARDKARDKARVRWRRESAWN